MHRLSSYQIDESGAEFPFSERLARENGWSGGYSQRVIEEYKRFLILCCDAGHPVTPSDAVDQAWHLHLCYTRSYWEDLCRDTLGKPIHHGPTRGGRAEDDKFTDWYQRTLESYQSQFGEAAPADIWPAANERFARRDFRRVDVSRHLVVSRRVLGMAAIAGAASLALASCSSVLMTVDLGGFVFLIVLCAVILAVVRLISGGEKRRRRGRGRRHGGRSGGRSGGSGCGAWWLGSGGGDGDDRDSSGCSSSGCSSSDGGGGGGGGGCGGGGGGGD